METTELVIEGVEKVKTRAVWYKAITKDSSGRKFYFPTSSVIAGFILQDL